MVVNLQGTSRTTGTLVEILTNVRKVTHMKSVVFKYVRRILIAELIIIFILLPMDVRSVFLFLGIIFFIFALFRTINVVVDGKTVKIGKGFAGGSGYSNQILISKLLESVLGDNRALERGKTMVLDKSTLVMIIMSITNVLLYLASEQVLKML